MFPRVGWELKHTSAPYQKTKTKFQKFYEINENVEIFKFKRFSFDFYLNFP